MKNNLVKKKDIKKIAKTLINKMICNSNMYYASVGLIIILVFILIIQKLYEVFRKDKDGLTTEDFKKKEQTDAVITSLISITVMLLTGYTTYCYKYTNDLFMTGFKPMHVQYTDNNYSNTNKSYANTSTGIINPDVATTRTNRYNP